MEANKDLISYIVISTSAVVLLLIVIIADIFILYRKRKIISQQEIKIRENKIDELIMKQEVENVNALLKGQNSERRRISQDLHDRLGGILFAAKLYNSTVKQKLTEIREEQQEEYEKLSYLIDEAVTEVRRLSHDLYQSSLSRFGYTVALKQLIAAIEQANEIKISFLTAGELDDTSEAMQQELYAITQEMLSNALKHADATNIEIAVNVDDQIEFHFNDNGKGFNTDKEHSGIGLLNIKRRAEKLNAKLTVESSAGKGTTYYLAIPNE